MMLIVFLYELTFEAAEKRAKIYKNELSKVFFTIILFYFISMIFANWIQSLKSYIEDAKIKKEKLRLKAQ
jgi:hypothetical protein